MAFFQASPFNPPPGFQQGGPGQTSLQQSNPPAPPPAQRETVTINYTLVLVPKKKRKPWQMHFSRKPLMQIKQHSAPDAAAGTPQSIAAPVDLFGNGPSVNTQPTPFSPSQPIAFGSATQAGSSTVPTSTIPFFNHTTLSSSRNSDPPGPQRPKAIYNLRAWRRNWNDVKFSTPNSEDLVASFSAGGYTMQLRGPSPNSMYTMKFVPDLQVGLGEVWKGRWRGSKWAWHAQNGIGEAVWRKTGELQGGQVVWRLELFPLRPPPRDLNAVSRAEDLQADGEVIAGRVGGSVWVQKGAGVGVLDGLYSQFSEA
ncbi:hypothetical protein L873DRAFT_1808447 [Choiromyces venosus 120613-1]|uniref:Uncharacterized protein n=1 Tax=Choiromyces venosus 120613-1 TaxID=1336337 RepID=A0A3N4JQM0_9PEZI|nr:hypothetical protein L873DRAFT_1808447 [Choiromyces venosus 120613-1]